MLRACPFWPVLSNKKEAKGNQRMLEHTGELNFPFTSYFASCFVARLLPHSKAGVLREPGNRTLLRSVKDR